ncbi:membrane protein required for colicin V production [Tistlia consotensis]|uniref:Membrane protein required for colicin V production n=1 Tax=Tistlia consotensis USBA 355 TaxID=560819 RepID=A0A1Y6B9N6_9PROT|nr:CvpA family protein [Tistlia consotensis]SMF00346.1 membrane protein required for colicin V production [Tistlia consotensis USBA 355]SNR75936.1 membrane protein required for colicin V production [Tistlia consotensis]
MNLPINAADVIVIAVLLVSAGLAFFRGLVHEVLAIAAWIGAALATLYFFLPAQSVSRQLIAIPLIADIVAGVVVFLLTLIVLTVISRMVSKRVQDSSLGALDRSLGFVFGLLRGAVIVCVAWLVLNWLLPPAEHPAWIREARSRPLVEAGAAALRSLAPDSLGWNLPPAPAEPAGSGQARPQATGNEAAKDDATGYKEGPRRQMQQLFESVGQDPAPGTSQ